MLYPANAGPNFEVPKKRAPGGLYRTTGGFLFLMHFLLKPASCTRGPVLKR